MIIGITSFAKFIGYALDNKCSQFGNYLYLSIVRVIAKKTLRLFWTRYPDSEQALKSWYKEAEEAVWKKVADIKKDYPSASVIIGNKIVFNIKGNHYRLIVLVNYDYALVWIRFIGTHTQYSKIDAEKI